MTTLAALLVLAFIVTILVIAVTAAISDRPQSPRTVRGGRWEVRELPVTDGVIVTAWHTDAKAQGSGRFVPYADPDFEASLHEARSAVEYRVAALNQQEHPPLLSQE